MIKAIVWAGLMGGAAWGQQFEVAAIRQQDWNMPGRGGGFRITGSRVTATDTLNRLIIDAYGVKQYQVTGGPSWVVPPGPVFVITAKVEGEAVPTAQQVRPMLQKLLADRFQLKLHREMKDLQVYDLVVAKNGVKMKLTPADSQGGMGFGNGRMIAPKMSMPQLANGLTGYLDRPVIDKTGLTADFDVRVEWAKDGQPDSGPSLIDAVEAQLGLKLEAAKAPIEILVIDHAEKPAGN
jgi:uncharacterized protein (TIGR03435 family)